MTVEDHGDYTITTTSDPDGAVFTTWRPKDGTSASNRQALRDRAQQALTVNSTFQAIAAPTNAQLLSQVQALTKQCNALIRLLLNAVDSTTGT